MPLTQLRKFEFRCDGYTPKGIRCETKMATEAVTNFEAEYYARNRGWKQDHRGWICGSPDGHRVP
jgi:hypothetical protein